MNTAYTLLRRASTAFVGLPLAVQVMLVALALVLIHMPFYVAWVASRKKLEREGRMRSELRRLLGE